MSSFAELGLAQEINRAIRDRGYTKPTPIQTQMIPLIVQGRDVIGLSQTGTGKTAAFVLPMLHRLAGGTTRAKPGHCSVLILSPTRELTNQSSDAIRRYGKYIGYAQTSIVGGVAYPPQIKALRRGVDIVIATPGRVLDHIEAGELSLAETAVIILDEADQMLDFGFLPVIKKITSRLPKERQSILLSATMPPAIKALAEDLMREVRLVEATPASKPVAKIHQRIIYVEKPRKNMALLEIVSAREVERAIVFTRTKYGADRVQAFLNKYGILAVSLHGDKSQGQRRRALGQFRGGEVNVLVATDIAGRGIDIDDVSHVINVDLPNIPENYVHRIGRTARAGRGGVAISFCSRTERAYLRDIEKLIGTELPKEQDKGGDKEHEPQKIAPPKMPKPRKEARKDKGKGGDKPKKEKQKGGGKPQRRPSIDANTLFPEELGFGHAKKSREEKKHAKEGRAGKALKAKSKGKTDKVKARAKFKSKVKSQVKGRGRRHFDAAAEGRLKRKPR